MYYLFLFQVPYFYGLITIKTQIGHHHLISTINSRIVQRFRRNDKTSEIAKISHKDSKNIT